MTKLDPNVLNQMNKISDDVQTNSSYIEEIVDSVLNPFMKDLDAYVKKIQGRLQDKKNPPTDSELDDYCLNLSTMIYFASEGAERIGIRDGVAKTTYKEMYNTCRLNCRKGTALDKTNQAELQSLKESVVSMAYASAYKTAKAKVDCAMELLASVKKVISKRQDEMKLTRMARD